MEKDKMLKEERERVLRAILSLGMEFSVDLLQFITRLDVEDVKRIIKETK